MRKDLDQLRTELDRLRRRECELLQELSDVRAAAEAQSKKIDDIIEMQSVSVIDRLPVEILSRILHLALSVTRYEEWEQHPLWKQQYAGVSRRWRDVILNSPSFWSAIILGFGWLSSCIVTHLARSREHLLDITIRQRSPYNELPCHLLCYAPRWCSLTILFTSSNRDPVHDLLIRFRGLSFPNLKHLYINGYGYIDAKFMKAGNTPALERLRLVQRGEDRLPISFLPAVGRLTALTLSGEIGRRKLKSSSILLPFLRSLTVDASDPSEILKAIVAPELSRFVGRFRSPLLGGIPPVFNKVHYTCVLSSTKKSIATVCQVFPNVRHLEIGAGALEFFYGLGERTDLWGDLESVTFRTLPVQEFEGVVNKLQGWVRQRKSTAKPLHMRFTSISCGNYRLERTGRLLSTLYDCLPNDCTLEIDQFPLLERTRVTALNPTLHMDLRHLPPSNVNMYLGQDVPLRELTSDFQYISEDESSYYTDDDDL
ncbi:hypothetical protein EDD15DRAFT_2230989 [Pisolithus albus]|nr:hypothetical protein EDD15DRAFT_2230989 [Pisolithus albus]